MSVLTWRDVATPDLSGAAYAQAQAQRAMNDAFNAAQGTIQGVKDLRSDAADRNIINRSLQYQTPEELQAALANGSVVGSDGQYAHAATLTALPNQVTAMLKNALTTADVGQTDANTSNINAGTRAQTVNTDQTAILNARANADDAAYKAAEPVLTNLITKYTPQGATGITDATKELEATPQFAGLNPTQQAAARNHLYTSIGAPVDAVNALQDTVKKGIDARATTEAEGLSRQFDQLKTQEEIFNSVNNVQDPLVRQKLQDRYSQKFPNLFPSQFSSIEANRGPVGQIKGVDFDPEAALFNPGGKYGYKPPPKGWSGTMVKEADAIGEGMRQVNKNDVLGGVDGKTPTGSSAKTQFMMLNGTMDDAAKALWKQNPDAFRQQGANNWDEIKLTPQNTEAMAKYTFDQVPHDTAALSKVWTSLKPDDLNVIAQSGFDWNVARPLIIARENGTTVDALAQKSLDQQQSQINAITGNAQRQASDPLVANYNKFMSAGSGASANAAAKFAIANEPLLKGIDEATLTNNITALIRTTKAEKGIDLSPDQAALALAQSVYDDQIGSATKRNFHNAFDTNGNKISSFSNRHIDLDQAGKKALEIVKPDTASEAKTLEQAQVAFRNAPFAAADFAAKYKHYQDMAVAYAKEPKNPAVAKNYADALANLGVASAYQGVNSRDAVSANPLSINMPPAPAPAPTPQAAAAAQATAALNQAVGAGPNTQPVRMTRIF